MSPKFRTVRLVRIFVSSPSDVELERKILAEAIERINANEGLEMSIQLNLWTWTEDAVPRIGPKPQQVIDSQTPHYDIYFGIMSARFGTPTGRTGSGTEKNFATPSNALRKRARHGYCFIFARIHRTTAAPMPWSNC